IQTYQYTAITIISLIILLTSKINTGLFTPYLILIITLIINYIVFRIQNRTEQESLNQLELVTAINLTIQLIIILLSNSYQSMFITQYTLQTGLIALILVIIPLIIQHPYIACTGPNEDQIRTLTLTLTISFMTISLIGLLSIISTITWYISLIIGIIGWIISITKYIKQSQKQATKIKTIQDLKKELGEKNT
ncbi:MAG: tetrahydromethanopterin S-methyltransferase subunit C, partial [Methanobacteriaceae archaeon]|nr:tetrahydromethanopterin S-methyltransferase subunit C [Methanobacteriaceae archaeon]